MVLQYNALQLLSDLQYQQVAGSQDLRKYFTLGSGQRDYCRSNRIL